MGVAKVCRDVVDLNPAGTCVGCSTGPEQAAQFAAELAKNGTLREFSASGKAIGERGVRAFGTEVLCWCAAPSCCAVLCHIPVRMRFCPGSALTVNHTLSSLCIGDSTMGDEQLSALCEGLAGNRGGVIADRVPSVVSLGPRPKAVTLVRHTLCRSNKA